MPNILLDVDTVNGYKKRIADLEQQIKFLEGFADPPDMKTGLTTRDELEQQLAEAQAEVERMINMLGVQFEKGVDECMERVAEMAVERRGHFASDAAAKRFAELLRAKIGNES